MPLVPEKDAPLTEFGELIPLSEVPRDPLQGGVAPWARRPLADLRRDASPLLMGGGVFGRGMYNPEQMLYGDTAVHVLRLALQYGFTALDSSPYYYPSELVLGRALRIVASEHPRSSYFLITKCGRYGPDRVHFDYSPERVERSLRESCQRLGTPYLDAGLLHDAEFVADQPPVDREPDGPWLPAQAVGVECARAKPRTTEEARALLGIRDADAATVRGPGDEKVLAAVRTLFKLKDEGLLRNVGISGYPLPELLRISRLVATHPPYRPLDLILSYSNHTLHSDLLPAYQRLLDEEPAPARGQRPWRPPMLLNASPFSMGLLSGRAPPGWHPADEALRAAADEATAKLHAAVDAWAPRGITRENVMGLTALFSGIRGSESFTDGVPSLRTLVGMSSVEEVHMAVAAYRALAAGAGSAESRTRLPPEEFECARAWYDALMRYERIVRDVMQKANVNAWCWPSPPPGA